MTASAAQISSRSLALGSSAGNTATTWTFTFSTAATTAVKGITFQVCDAPSGTCNVPGSWAGTGSGLTSLTFNGSSQSGWTIDNTAGYLRIKNDAASTTVTNPVVATFGSVTNPNTTNATFYVRINTYSATAYGTGVDSGVVAASTSQLITLNGTMDESLVFCTGTSITGTNCGTVTGSNVALGTFSTTVPTSGTSVMAASTNASSGYSITMNGTTLTCASCAGTPTIGALATQTASTPGSPQFGANLKLNTAPSVGADVTGSGSGAPTANYNTADSFRFVSGDSVAAAAGTSAANKYTVSYVVNVPGDQPAGIYSAVMTYICTATY
ncbi:MAG: hypothetical protein WDN27_03905 [Candidatus Saccharibacteria bacterium]